MINRALNNIGMNRVVFSLSVARLADAIGNSVLFIIIPLYVAQLPAPWFPLPESVRVGLLISLYGLLNAGVQPLMGALSDRLGRRKPLILIGLLVTGVATLAFSVVGRFTDLLVFRSLQGVGAAMTIPASMALMASATDKRTRGGAMGIYSAMRMVGFAVGPLMGGSLQVLFGFNAAFFAGAAFILVGAILVQFGIHEPATLRPAAVAAKVRSRFQVIDPKLLSAGILGAGLATFVMSIAFSMMTTLENEFNARLHQDALGFSIAFSALTISRLIFQVPLGRLSDRIGRRPLIIWGLILMAPATVLLGEAANTWQLTGLRLFQGFASAGVAAPAFAVAADLAKSGSEGRQMSIITMGFGLGTALGPLFTGILALSSFELPFVIGGLILLVGAWAVYRYVPETVPARIARSPVPEIVRRNRK